MKVFLAGATGAIGNHLVPQLVARGYEVIGMTRSPGKVASLKATGVEAVVADGLDRTAVVRAVGEAEPDVVIHQMTGLTGASDLKKFDDDFALTNELRTNGTDHLLEAAKRSGVRRVIV
ncbi:MAG: NAD-dependent epimerase/dehydratase family protein, partial [Actinomycetota bacterium]